MGKKKQSHAQEGLLIAFVAVCFVLATATLIMAIGESDAGGDTQEFFSASLSGTTPAPSPSVIAPTPRPHTGGGNGAGSGAGSGGGNEHQADDHEDDGRQATLSARFEAEQLGIAY